MTNFSWYRRAQESIAHSALTNSKRPETFVFGVYPTHLERGHGCYVTDTQGRQYIDFICGLGTNLLGYNNRHIKEAIQNKLDTGFSLSLSSTMEVEFAEKFKACFPFVDRIRILKSGSDACTAAIRMARAVTGWNLIASEGYHGWHDEFISMTPPAKGIPTHFSETIGSIHDSWDYDRLAGIIIEPVITDFSDTRMIFLKKLREICNAHDIILIFDETITGLRFPGLSVAVWSGVTPDLIITGKALGGGMPISVVGGKKDVMESDYFVSSTFSGERLSIAAAMETLDLLRTEHPVINIWEQAKIFQDAFNQINPDLIKMEGYPTRGIWKAKDDLTKALFFQECCKARILVGPSYFWNLNHAELTFELIKTFTAILIKIGNNEVILEGEIPKKPFAETVRQMD